MSSVMLFKHLHCCFISIQDILDKVDHFLGAVESDVQACVMCFLSHGSDGKFAGTDGRDVIISDLINKLCSCPSLYNKPKMMLFQACRGSTYQFIFIFKKC